MIHLFRCCGFFCASVCLSGVCELPLHFISVFVLWDLSDCIFLAVSVIKEFHPFFYTLLKLASVKKRINGKKKKLMDTRFKIFNCTVICI